MGAGRQNRLGCPSLDPGAQGPLPAQRVKKSLTRLPMTASSHSRAGPAMGFESHHCHHTLRWNKKKNKERFTTESSHRMEAKGRAAFFVH